MSTPDEETLLRLAKAVAEGTPVDWEREAAAQPALRPQLEKLRALEGIAALNPEADPDPLIGQTLSHFRIRERIGAGGMGVIYRAEDRSLRRPVALKVLPPDLVTSEERRRRLLREARTEAAVAHPNIAAIYEVGEAAENIFIAMELVEGETLRERIGGRPLPIRETLRIAIEMAEGLAYAHQAHVIHRDLKPANVVVRPDGHVKILDFGLAKLTEEETDSKSSELSRSDASSVEVTEAGKLMGTPAYMSPEQVRGEPLDARSDLFAFGSTLYEMATGKAPFRGQTPADTLASILRGEPTSPRRLNPEVPPRLEEIIGKCLEKDPQDRYARAEEIVTNLRALASGSGGGVAVDRVSGTDLEAKKGDVGPARRGHPAQPESERRLAAVLSADAVGYSRLMANDEASTIQTLNAYRQAIGSLVEQHWGSVVDSPGDNLLAEFPNALDAVQCAAEIQGVLRVRNQSLAEDRRMLFRIGVHLGDITAKDERVYGDGVNIASRLEGMAEPGGICISRSVYEVVHGKVSLCFEDLGEQEIKNIPDPVWAYQINVELNQQLATPKRRSNLRRWAVGAGALILLLGIAVATWRQMEPTTRGSSTDAAPIHSLAVLPFVNMSGDPKQEFFSDGISEELLTALTKVKGLRVTSRTSAFAFKGRSIPIPELAATLGVEHVLEGSVRIAGNRVRVTAQLIDVETDSHLWSETYDRELSDIFAVQDEIASKVGKALKVALLGADSKPIRATPETSIEAYSDYLLARQKMASISHANLLEVELLLRGVIEREPSYAPAYTTLAEAYLDMWRWGMLSNSEYSARTIPLVEKALSLDDQLADAWQHLSLLRFDNQDLEGAREAAERALAIDPQNPFVLKRQIIFWMFTHEPERGLGYAEELLRVDPLSLPSLISIAFLYLRLGHFDDMERTIEAMRSIDSKDLHYLWGAWVLALSRGDLVSALRLQQEAATIDSGDPENAFTIAMTCFDLGDVDAAKSWNDATLRLDPEASGARLVTALLHLYDGEEAEAVAVARENTRSDFDRYEFGGIFLRMVAAQDLAAGNHEAIITRYLTHYPELADDRFPSWLVLSESLVWEAFLVTLDLSSAYLHAGDNAKAESLLSQVESELPHWPQAAANGWGFGFADVELHALRGDRDRALAALREHAATGTRYMWRWQLLYNPNLDSIRDTAEFAAVVAEIEADMAAQLELVREMQQRGELTPIPRAEATAESQPSHAGP